jgi:hypothetical protein
MGDTPHPGGTEEVPDGGVFKLKVWTPGLKSRVHGREFLSKDNVIARRFPQMGHLVEAPFQDFLRSRIGI